MCLPKQIAPVSTQQSIKGITWLSPCKRWMLCIHYKQYYGRGK
jgi:hypothetical protein